MTGDVHESGFVQLTSPKHGKYSWANARCILLLSGDVSSLLTSSALT